MFRERILRSLVVFSMIFALAGLVYPQGTRTRITGVVYDSNGAPVAGASVILKDEGTGATLTAQTGDSGNYTFDLIQPGSYEVTVEKQGFKKLISSHNQA